MSRHLQRLLTLLLALCLAVTLAQPGFVAADDDDDWDDDDEWSEVDDDDWDDDDDDDDDWDDDAIDVDDPIFVDASDWDEDLNDYGNEDDDQPIAARAIVQLAPGIDPDAFAARYGAVVLRVVAGPNIVLLGIGDRSLASVAAPMSAFAQDDEMDDDELDDDDDLDDLDDNFDDDDIDDDVDTPDDVDDDEDDFDEDDDDVDDVDDDDLQPVIDDDFYTRYPVREDRRADLTAILSDPDVLWAEFNFTSRAPEGRPRYFFTSSVGEPQVVEEPALPQGLEMQPGVCATGNAVTVAVLDTGVDTTHPAIADNILDNGVDMLRVSRDVSDTGNGIDDDGDGLVDEMVGHGTHVAGTILQVAPDAQILPVKVLDSDGNGDTFSVMAGIVYAVEQDADIINLSLGSTWDSAAIAWAVSYAEQQGVLVIAAAGNGDRETPMEYPASNPGVISVAATDAAGDKATYSNYNTMVDISAPGDNVASAYPGGTYTTASGTSMSAPLVSGTAALMLERSPTMTPQVVRDRVVNSAAPLNLSDPAYDGKMGGGELDVNAALVCGG